MNSHRRHGSTETARVDAAVLTSTLNLTTACRRIVRHARAYVIMIAVVTALLAGCEPNPNPNLVPRVPTPAPGPNRKPEPPVNPQTFANSVVIGSFGGYEETPATVRRLTLRRSESGALSR